MADEKWKKVKNIFDGALAVKPEDRQQYLVEACGSDSALLAEIKSLLASLGQAGEFMESPAIGEVADIIDTRTEQMNQDSIDKPGDAGQIVVNSSSIIGTTVKERYLVEKQLDKGGFGSVYLARDLQIVSRPVVIKILHKDRVSNSWAVNKFRHEVEALARINHPGIVGILDTGELPEGIPFIVMQYVDGVTLRKLLQPEGMDFERAAHIIKEISHALEEAHSKKIFHRDLKPENIMIRSLASGNEQVTLIDFGIAKVKNSVLAPSTMTQAAAGTVSYMSPEQLNAQSVTAPSDIYSVGIIFYEMLTGRHPFNFDSIGQLFYMQQTGIRIMPVDLRPSIPAQVQAILLKALSFEPKDRYQNVRQFGDELAVALLSEEDSIVQRTSGQEATAKFPTAESAIVLPTEPSPKITSELFKTPSDNSGSVSNSQSSRWVILSLAALLLLGGAAAAIWFGSAYFLSNKSNTSNVSPIVPSSNNGPVLSSAPARQLTFSLTVQKMDNYRPLGAPFESNGEEVFASGWKFRFNLAPSDSGFLYVIDEGQNQKGENAFFVLFPTPKNNNGSARIESGQKLQTLWNVFDNNPGKEKVWFIWSARQNPDLEKIAEDSVKAGFSVNDQSQIDFLRQFCSSETADKTKIEKIEKDPQNPTAIIKGNGDLIANFVELAHKPY